MTRIRGLLALLAVLAVAAGASAAQAHTKSETNTAWRVAGPDVHVTLTAPDLEVRRIPTPGDAPADDAQLAAYVAPRVGATAAGRPCPAAAPPHALAAAPGYRRLELAYRCPSAEGIALRFAAFADLVPTHVDFAQVEPDGAPFVEQVFTKDHDTVALGKGGDGLKNAPFVEYVRLGIMHIFTGLDHQCFLLGMVLLCRRVRDLLFVVTGFTLGHSATLALAVTGVIRPHAEYIDALVALTIVLIGVENVAVATRRPLLLATGLAVLLVGMAGLKALGLPGLPVLLSAGGALFAGNYLLISGSLMDAGRLRLIVTLVFGLIHGFGFAADLLEMRLPQERLAELLFGFNLGVEIAQLTLVLSALGLAAALSRMRLAPPRAVVVDGGSALLIAIGLYWFVSRTFALPVAGLG